MKTNIAALAAGMLFVVAAGRAAAGPITCEDALNADAVSETLTDTNAFGAHVDAVDAVDAPDVYTLIVNRIYEVPEPSSGILVGSLLAGLAAARRRWSADVRHSPTI